MTEKLCLLKQNVGEVERCPEKRCAFWETGGAVLDGGCAIERIGLTTEIGRTPGLAHWMLDLRARLEEADTHAERREVHQLFDRLLPPELRD